MQPANTECSGDLFSASWNVEREHRTLTSLWTPWAMTDSDGSDKDAVSTLVLVGDKEYVLRSSRRRVLFDGYCCAEVSLEQAFTLTLDSRHPDSTSSMEDAAVPIILSTPSTSRFELSVDNVTSSPFECLLDHRSPRSYSIKFRPPEVSESDYAWDNFQDQVVIHTRLSKLVVRLEAWKTAVPASLLPEQESSLLFPVALPDVKAPPLRLFGAIERNADNKDPHQRHDAPSRSFTETTKIPSSLVSKAAHNLDVPSTPGTSRTESLPSLSRPTSSERTSSLLPICGNPAISSSENVAQLPLPIVTAVESQREAREVILKLRSRRVHQNNTKIHLGTSPTSVADPELFPETVALDADMKADLDNFNNLVVAVRDQVTKETAKAKSELAYYQQLLPKPPSREAAPETPSTAPAAQKLRKPRQLSAMTKRPSKLPSLVRLSSGVASTSSLNAPYMISVNNQEIPSLEQVPHRLSARQRFSRKTKLQSLSASVQDLRCSQQQPEVTQRSTKSTPRKKSANNQLQQSDDLTDFDDPDPEVDDAPIVPDDLSGVATLDADDY